MAEGIEYTPQILAFVLDSSQVVSYKWLSRKFSVPSNEAQRLLQIVAEQHGSSIDVIYAVSGWSKTDRHCYSVQLVPKSKLQQAKDMLDGHVSSHVYSIQPCIPKDPAELWSTEYVQSEELFKQPPELNNCLRDNRFSAVSCISITRKVPGTSSAGNALLAASKVAAPSSSSSKLLIVKAEVPTAQASTSGPPSLSKPIALGDSAKDAGTGSHGSATVTGPGSKGVVTVPNKKKTAGSGDGALANLWGRVSRKPKPTLLEAQVGSAVEEDAAPGNVDTFARAQDASFDASSDDDATNFARIRRGQVKSSSGRKRRVIIDDDMSDVEDEDLDSENIVSLSSPEVRKERPDSSAASKRKKSDGKAWDVALKEEKVETSPGGKNGGSSPSKASPPSAHVSFKEVRVDRADIVLKSEEKSGNNPLVEAEDKTNKSVQAAEKGASSAAAPGPKKRKVLKTRIDDRGREVTEVVWENNDTAVSLDNKDENCLKDADAHAHAKIEPLKAPSNRSLASANAKASNTAAQNPSNKASGNKPSGKAAPKDSQRRKISSFFQKKS